MDEVARVGFDRTMASLDCVVAAARLLLEPLGIGVTDTSNRSGVDWAVEAPRWSFDFVQKRVLPPYTVRITARVGLLPKMKDGEADEWVATWRAEAWRGVSPSFHIVDGAASVGPALMTYGSFERLVLALLRRAAPAFPDEVTDATWPVFPPLPDVQAEVDHLVEVKAFHRSQIEPWTGPPAGCLEAEVAALETRVGWRLPLAYKQYLRFMGADRRGVFVGSDWFIESATVNTISTELAYMEVEYTPPGDTFEFMSHHGYIHGWFDLPITSDDPPVHFYNEGQGNNLVFDHVRFTTLLLAELRYMSSFTRKVRPRRTPE